MAEPPQAFLESIDCPFETDAPIGRRTWYGIGGKAGICAHPRNIEQLTALGRWAHHQNVPLRVLGKGANLLVASAEVDGIVLMLDAPPFRSIEIDQDLCTVTCGGGAPLEQTITTAVRAGLEGLEHLAGIPATIGGALRMNAGGAFGEIGPAVLSITAMGPNGEMEPWTRDDYEYAYRKTNLTDHIVAEAVFALKKTETPEALRAELKRVMKFKKDSQPMADDSAGCAFKNPIGRSDKPAGRLIDEAGLKGFRIGGAEVSNIHANFIVLHEGAKATNVLALMNHVQQAVREKHGVELEREVVVW
ncbi:MAG: UDP-N-acetylmuramate dehydrogenase [Phycisphaeraceae bacterium]|nr:UDP-N-acetylmuramate dehydrogenase [Phycisphaeraceae bacterium]